MRGKLRRQGQMGTGRAFSRAVALRISLSMSRLLQLSFSGLRANRRVARENGGSLIDRRPGALADLVAIPFFPSFMRGADPGVFVRFGLPIRVALPNVARCLPGSRFSPADPAATVLTWKPR